MLPKSFALSDDDEESDCSIPRDDCEPVQTVPNDCPVEINEYSSTPIEVPNICWHGYSNYPKSLTMTNTGESVQITGKWGRGRPYVTGGPLNGSYLFSQIHFHWPSEHMLNEKRYPLEMHAVHYKAAYLTQERAMKENDGTLVLVYLFEIGPESTTNMCKITKHLSKVKKKNCKTEICDSSLEDFMKPFLSNYFVYWGSAEIGESSYSLQWIISCSRLPISHSEYCDLKELFRGEDGERARKSKRDARPMSKDIFLVGDTIGRTISETHRSEVRFSDVERSSVSAERSKSCCFLAKYRRRNSNSPRGKDCFSNKSVEQIYSRPSSSRCSRESSPCSRTVLKSNKSCTDKNCQTSVHDPCNMNTQTSLRSVCTCSSVKSKQPSSCGSKSKYSDSYICEDPYSSVTSCKDDEPCAKQKKKVPRCFLKNNETHDCVGNGCEKQVCSADCDRNNCESKSSNKCKRTKKEKSSKRKRRRSSKDSTSSCDETDEKTECTVECEVKGAKKNDQETYHIVKCKIECPDEDEKLRKKKKNMGKPQKKEEVVESADPPPEEKPPKNKDEVDTATKSESTTGSVEAKEGEGKAKYGLTPGVEDEVKGSKKSGGKTAEDVASEDAPKQMGQHKPIILAPATVDENTYVLKSVGTMTAFSPYPAYIEEIGRAGEGGEALLTGSSISRSHIWKRERKVPAKEQRTMDKILGIPECEETKDLEVIPSNVGNQRELTTLKEQSHNTVLAEETDSVAKEQSLASLLAKISKDPSLGNILSKISGQSAQSSDAEKVATEPSFGSILAKMSKDPSLACILTKISRDASRGRVSEGPSGVKIETEPSTVKVVPKSSTEKISREPSVAAIWAKLKTQSSELDKSSKEPSLSSVLAKLSRDMSISNDVNKSLKDPISITDPAKSSKEHALTIILGSVSGDRKLASESVSKHSSLTSILYKVSKEPTLTSDLAKSSKHQSTNAFAGCKDAAVPEVVTVSTKEDPNMLSKSYKQLKSPESTKEQSLVSVLVRVSKEPSLAKDLANILKQEPLPEDITKPMEQSFASVLVRISKEPSLASDLANILKKESVAEGMGIERVTSASNGVAKPLTKTTEESLANILVAVSKEPSLAAGLAKCSEQQSLASILTKVSKASSLAVDVANVLYHNTARSGTEESLASIFASKPKEASLVANSVKFSNEQSVADLSAKAYNNLSFVTDSVNTQTKDAKEPGIKQLTKEQSLASVLVKISKEPSLAADPVNVLTNASETSELTRKAKEQPLSNIIAEASTDALLASDMANILKRESQTSHSDKSVIGELLGNILAAVSKEPALASDIAKCTNLQSMVSILSKISNKPSLVVDKANILKQETFSEGFVKPAEDQALACNLAAVKDPPMMVDLANVPQEAFLLGDLAETPKKESLGAILDRVSRERSNANEVAKPVVEASLAEILPAAASKKSQLASEISKHAVNQSLANVLNKVTREPSLANDIVNSFAKESLAEIFFAVTKEPSLASDISRYSKNQSLINIMDRVSREPSLAKDLAESVAEDAAGEILFAVTKNPSLVPEIRKHSKTTSLLNIVNRVSREPSLADDIAKSIVQDTVIEILLAVAKDPSLASNISKHSRNKSLNNVLDRISKDPSLATDLANSFNDSLPEVFHQTVKQPSLKSGTSKYSRNQSLINILERISREQSFTTNLVNILKEELLTDDPSKSVREEPWHSGLTKNQKASSMSSMKPKIVVSDSAKIKHQSLASILDRISRVPSACTSSAKSAAEQTLANILASLVNESSSTADLGELKQNSLVDILLKVSKEPSLASDLTNIAKKMPKESPAPFHSAEEVYLIDILSQHQPMNAEDPSKNVKDNSLTKVLATASKETDSAIFASGNATSNNVEPVADASLPREGQLPVNFVTPLADQSLASISGTVSTKSATAINLLKSPVPGVHSEISKNQTSEESLARSGKDLPLPKTSAEPLESVNTASSTVISVRIESSPAEDSASPVERATILKSSRSYTVSREDVVRRGQTREQEKTRVNFETEPIHQSVIDTERPEVEKLHRQEDLNESIKSRRSTDTRRSGDDEMSLDSYKKKIMVSSEESQLYSKVEGEEKDMQPFEEYYVRVENENSVLQEYSGKIGSSEIVSGNSVKLRLLPKTSIPMDDLNLEMEDCIIRFDSKEKTEELYVEAHFLVSKKSSCRGENRKSIQSISPSSLKALEITDSIQDTASENSLARKKVLYFKSEGIEVDPKTGKKILIGHFTRDNNCKFALIRFYGIIDLINEFFPH